MIAHKELAQVRNLLEAIFSLAEDILEKGGEDCPVVISNIKEDLKEVLNRNSEKTEVA